MKHLLHFIIATACAITACDDDTALRTESDAQDTKVSVSDGILHFATAQDFRDYSLRMANLGTEERAKEEDANGFTSMLTYAETLLADVDANEGALQASPEIFSYSTDTVDDALMVRADIEVPASVAAAANTDGFYYIGDVIYKVDRHCQAYVRGGDAEAVSKVLSGESEADGVNSFLHRYELGVANLKSSSLRINELKGSIRNSSRWMDYTVKIQFINSEDKWIYGYLQLVQTAKCFKKKHRRWREHHAECYFHNVRTSVIHPSVGEEWLYCSNYNGGDNVNHRYTEIIKTITEYDREDVSNAPYFRFLSGTSGCSGINDQLDLNTLLEDELKRQ